MNRTTVYMVIFPVVLFSQISRFSPRENFHFNTWLFIVMKISQNREIKPSRIPQPSPKIAKISVREIYGVYSIRNGSMANEKENIFFFLLYLPFVCESSSSAVWCAPDLCCLSSSSFLSLSLSSSSSLCLLLSEAELFVPRPLIASVAQLIAVSIAMSVTVSVTVSITLSVTVSVIVSITLSVTVSVIVFVAVSITVSITLSVTMSVIVSVAVSIILSVTLSVTPSAVDRLTAGVSLQVPVLSRCHGLDLLLQYSYFLLECLVFIPEQRKEKILKVIKIIISKCILYYSQCKKGHNEVCWNFLFTLV